MKVIKVPYNVYTLKGNAGFLTPSAAGIDPKIENEVICDPIQGSVADCFFLAALGSCAWNTPPPIIPIKPPNNFALDFTIPFWFNGLCRIPLFLIDFSWVQTVCQFMHSLLLKMRSGWQSTKRRSPSLKVVHLIQRGTRIFPLPSKTGSALDALVNLTNKKYSFTAPQTAFSTKNAPPSPFNGQNCVDYYDIIKTVCTPNAASPSSGKTNKPMVAWTYDSEPLEWKNKGFLYRYPTTNLDRMLVAKHTYSILGYYTSGGNKYIVLRDPLGKWGTKSPQEESGH